MKTTLLLLALCLLAMAQIPKNGPIQRDGLVKTTKEYLFVDDALAAAAGDLGQCDAIKIKLPLDQLDIRHGIVEAYWFKKYSHIHTLDIICEVTK